MLKLPDLASPVTIVRYDLSTTYTTHIALCRHVQKERKSNKHKSIKVRCQVHKGGRMSPTNNQIPTTLGFLPALPLPASS